MKKLRISIMLFIILLMGACSSKTVFDERFQFTDYKWNHFKPIVFTVNITDINICYDLLLTLRYIPQIPYEKFPVLIQIKDPSGGERTFTHTFKIKDPDGNLIGEGLGDLWDLEDKAKEYFFFNETGKYEFKISQYTQYYDAVCIMDLGLKINKSKIDYNIESE